MSTHGTETVQRRRTATLTARSRRRAGAAFVAMGALFLTGLMLLSAMAPNYDFHGAAISDLGVIPATAVWFNALLVTVGALAVAAGFFYYRTHGRRWLLALFVFAGTGAAIAGLFPLDTGGVHSLGAPS